MRIQHNISAMNSYRNYNNNAKALSSNLEKLSSGYKINRAGDDAAGLAISEKMRAQISGLSQAQRNVKDGISLVKTAEGALQEVQDMMNRMVTLATQSANGTYDNKVDRANLQKEVDALKSEIDRIADSSNFNGQKLLNGELASGSTTSNVKLELNDLTKGALKESAGQAGAKTVKGISTAVGGAADFEQKLTFTIERDGKQEEHTLTLTQAKGAQKLTGTIDGGDTIEVKGTTTTTGQLTQEEIHNGFVKLLQEADWAKDDFVVADANSADLIITNKNVGTDTPKIVSIRSERSEDTNNVDTSLAIEETTKALDKVPQLDVNALKIDSNNASKADVQSKIFEVDGRKFAIVSSAVTAANAESLGIAKDVILVNSGKGDGANNIATGDIQGIVDKINEVVGKEVFFQQAATDTKMSYNGSITKDGEGEGLTLQIGDTAENFNQLKVSVGDMHTKSLGIADIDISNIEGAQKAIETIKTAINTVSSTRGDLGAIQNRLEHTQNNLSVMQENIQDAESTIRDTDVADEMTTYTKNNILLQSAQAMLAQANQMPQGVLQLLQ